MLPQPFEADAIIIGISMASDKEAEDGMPPFISDSRQYSALSLTPPCRVSHVSFCWVVSDFPNGLQFFQEQGRAHLDFSSSNPHNSRCESRAGLPGTMSGKKPDKIFLLVVLFCQFTRSPQSGTEGSKSRPGARRGAGPGPLCWTAAAHPVLLTVCWPEQEPPPTSQAH